MKQSLWLIGGLLCSLTALADSTSKEDLIAMARSAAPAIVSDDATILYRGEVLVEGNNDWVCMPETFPDDGAPMCNDQVWMQMMQAVSTKADFTPTELGFSYMLQGDDGVSNSDPYHPDHKNADDFIKEGAHLMIIVPRELLEGITDDPHAGGPYVMWGDTPYAHIMVPLDREK